MIDDIHKDAITRMGKTIQLLQKGFSKIRTSRAHPELLSDIIVHSYGTDMPLHSVANIGVQDAFTLVLNVFDKSLTSDIEKAIMKANLGLNPTTVDGIIRVPLPAFTEERRKELVRIVRNEAEKAKVAIRNIRRDVNQQLKSLLKEKKIAKDENNVAEANIQKTTDIRIAEINDLLSVKEAEIMEI